MIKSKYLLQLAWLLFFTFLVIPSAYNQISATVIDANTKKAIPYVNVWVESQNISTISDEKGFFKLKPFDKITPVVLSTVGYTTSKINSNLIRDTIKLKPHIIQLNEVVVRGADKRKKTKKIGKIKQSKVRKYIDGNKEYHLYAKYFNYDSIYNQTPWLSEIHLATQSNSEEAKLNVQLLAKGENGKPGHSIYPKNIVVTVKKGKNRTRIDLSSLNFRFPKDGFFITIESLPGLENNNFWGSFGPSIGFLQLETDKDSWYYRYGGWQKIWQNKGEVKYYKDKYNHLAMELILSN